MLGGVPGLDPSERAQSHPEGMWREESDRGRLRRCVCVNGQTGVRRYVGRQENRTWGRGNRTEPGERGMGQNPGKGDLVDTQLQSFSWHRTDPSPKE